jgi:hypothetical protein
LLFEAQTDASGFCLLCAASLFGGCSSFGCVHPGGRVRSIFEIRIFLYRRGADSEAQHPAREGTLRLWVPMCLSVLGCLGARGFGFGVGRQNQQLFDQYSDRLLVGPHLSQFARVVMN